MFSKFDKKLVRNWMVMTELLGNWTLCGSVASIHSAFMLLRLLRTLLDKIYFV